MRRSPAWYPLHRAAVARPARHAALAAVRRDVRRARRDGSAQRARRDEARETSAARLELRTRFLTRRFAKHAPAWQFVVWARQFGLFLDYAVPTLLLDFLHSSCTLVFWHSSPPPAETLHLE